MPGVVFFYKTKGFIFILGQRKLEVVLGGDNIANFAFQAKLDSFAFKSLTVFNKIEEVLIRLAPKKHTFSDTHSKVHDTDTVYESVCWGEGGAEKESEDCFPGVVRTP